MKNYIGDSRLPLVIGQLVGVISFESNQEYLKEVIGPARLELFESILKEIVGSFFDQGERAQGLKK